MQYKPYNSNYDVIISCINGGFACDMQQSRSKHVDLLVRSSKSADKSDNRVILQRAIICYFLHFKKGKEPKSEHSLFFDHFQD